MLIRNILSKFYLSSKKGIVSLNLLNSNNKTGKLMYDQYLMKNISGCSIFKPINYLTNSLCFKFS